MTEMEMNIAGDIMFWSFSRFKGIENVSYEEMVNTFWKEEYFDTCAMNTPETGLEMPHE